MAKTNPGETVERIFSAFLSPLVLGGQMVPGKPFGASVLSELEDGREPVTSDSYLLVQSARVHLARRYVGIDLFEMPSKAEWQVAGALHDLVLSTHPHFEGAFKRGSRKKLLEGVPGSLALAPTPRTVREALSRHTLFSRILEVARTHKAVSWWTGKASFIGTDPPKRLLAWPEARRVRVDTTNHPWTGLPVAGMDALREQAFDAFLDRSPLTDLATCTRSFVPFRFRDGLLAILGSHGGECIGVRMLREKSDVGAVDHVLGVALGHLLLKKDFRALGVLTDFLRERELGRWW
jgi:hypothetical protein